MKKTTSGFTIVELLIVIVVIGILAAITIVAYNGVQTRAKTNKTVTAVSQWAKAIKLYQVDIGSWPGTASCLGSTSTYDGDGKCWSSGPWIVQSSFVNIIKPYLGSGVPEPDVMRVTYTVTDTGRGGRYENGNIYYFLANESACPLVGGITQSYTAVYANGVQCGGAIN